MTNVLARSKMAVNEVHTALLNEAINPGFNPLTLSAQAGFIL
jgi:hypothetical protein